MQLRTTIVRTARIWLVFIVFLSLREKGPAFLGRDWEGVVFSGRYSHTTVVFDNKLWIIGGSVSEIRASNESNDVWNSSDGVSWKQITAEAAFPARTDHTSVVFDNKIWVIGGRSKLSPMNDVWSSTDGANWTLMSAHAPFSARSSHTSVVFNNRMWVIKGNRNSTSQPYNNPLTDVWSSADGVTWRQETASYSLGGRFGHTSVVFHDRIWIIAGYQWNYDPGPRVPYSEFKAVNSVFSSADGVSWIQEPSFPLPRGDHGSAVFDNKMWVIGTQDVWNSSDGKAWSQVVPSGAFPKRADRTCTVFDNKLWVIGGRTEYGGMNDVWSSDNGTTWTKRIDRFSARAYQASEVFNDKLWILGGLLESGHVSNEVWNSDDGVSWTQVTAAAAFSPRGAWHASAVFDHKLWIVGGYTPGFRNDVWSSANGKNWIEATPHAAFSPRFSHTCTVFKNKLWVIGGFSINTSKNDVWNSDNGATWTLMTGAAPFPPRLGHTTLVFKDKLWVIGGINNSSYPGTYLNDVWSSDDGVSWTKANDSANFSARAGHTSFVFDDKIWIIGGTGQSGELNDVWNSQDGINWEQITAAAGFTPRDGHSSAIFRQKLWVIGGNNTSGKSDDVWFSDLRDVEVSPLIQGSSQAGDSLVNIDWFSNAATAGTALRMELWDGDGFAGFLGNVYDADGEATSTLYLPPVPERDDYYIHAVSAYDPKLSAESTTFTVTGGSMRVYFPQGGETWPVASTQLIQWLSNTDFSGTAVRAELWDDVGKIAELGDFWDPNGTGADVVTVPNVMNGSDYFIRAVSLWDDQYFADSQGRFTITGGLQQRTKSTAVQQETWLLYP